MIKIVSFNTNSIRTREHQLKALKEKYDPDIIGIQETKVQDEDFPVSMVEKLGYKAYYYGQKTHYGVALLSKTEPQSVTRGYHADPDDAQRRLICGTFKTIAGEDLVVINGYFPQGETREHVSKFPAKRKFYADFMDYLRQTYNPEQKLLVIGDMNIAPLDKDIGIGAENAKRWLRTGKCCFLPEEREWMQTLIDWGLKDTFRTCHPDADDQFSWFDYRSRGFEREPKRGLRIDLVLATESLNRQCIDAGIDYDIRSMDKPSDHCPIWATFDL